MDIKDHKMTSPSGHGNHGVYLCHKCGWPFPNLHPSARHRRAHKRICGTIEGYTMIDPGEHANSSVSDDEHGSDEDQQTPSPKTEKRRTNEFSSGGVGGISNRSEEDVYSNAVTEFWDIGFGPGKEEQLEGARVSDKNVEQVVEGDWGTNQQLKVDATTGIVQLPNTPPDSSQMHSPNVLETAANLLASATPSEDIALSSNSDSVISSKNMTEELAVGISGVNNSATDFSLGKSEALTNAPKEHVKADIGDHGMQYSTVILEQETDVKRNEDSNVDKVLSVFAVTPSKTASETSEVACNLQETDLKISDSATANQIVESKEEQSHELVPTMSLRDLSPEVKSFEQMEALVNSAPIESDYAEDINVGSRGDSVESCYPKEENVNVHVLSVASNIPTIDRGEIMIEDFKDHKKVKWNLPVTLDSGEVIEPVVDNNRDAVYGENQSSFCPSNSVESIHISSADLHALEDNLTQKGGGDVLVAEVPIEGQAKTSELKVSSEDLRSNTVEAPPETTRSGTQEIQTDSHLEGHQPHDIHNDSSQEYLPEPTTMGLSGVIPMAISMDDKVGHSTNFSESTNADDLEKDKLEKCDTDGKDSGEVDVEEPSTMIKTTYESADDLSVSKTNQTTNLLGAGNRGEHENAGKISDLPGNESRGMAVEEKPEMCSEMTLESECRLSEPEIAAEDGIDKVAYDLQETKSTAYQNSSEVGPDSSHLGLMAPTQFDSQNCQVEDSQEALKEPNFSSKNEVLAENVGAVCKGAKSNRDGDAEIIQKISEIPPDHLRLESEYPVKSSATVEDSHCKEGDLGGSGISAEYMLEEGDEKLTKQPVEVSSVYISADSQTDSLEGNSLEGNWGSVSVLSIQSDAPAAIDELSPSTASQAQAQSEKVNLQKPQTTSEGHHSNESDVFEAPSFMTLVERGNGVDQKAAFFDIQAGQNTQRPKSEALQGRKKNEEIIAKVTNWSAGKQHTPLKSLLGEAKPMSPNPKQTATVIKKHENTTKSNDALAATDDQVAKRETGKEWNSSTDNKKEKGKKVKGRPYWVPFVCCSSVN